MADPVISDLIAEIRQELNDSTGTRFTTDDCLVFIKKAARRVSHIARANDLQFAKKEASYTATPTTTSFALPADFVADVGLWNKATSKQMQKLTDEMWQSTESTLECSAWKIGNGVLEITSAPSANTTLELVYYFGDSNNFRSLTTTSAVPYGNALFDLFVEYAAIRMKNLDEMDFSADSQLMQEFEARVIATAKSHSQTIRLKKGWC